MSMFNLKSFSGYRLVNESLDQKATAALEDYESVPDEFVEYKYQDKLNDIRKDLDYFKSRLDDAKTGEAKQKYLKLIDDLIDQEKQLMGVISTDEKHELDKSSFVASRVAEEV